METTTLGRTGLIVSRTGFGALPIQRAGMEDAVAILRRAFEGGITFYDTARGYSDSEEKLGRALGDVRKDIVIATKCSGAASRADVLRLAEESLKALGTDYVDVLQLHNPPACPDPADGESAYAGLMEAKRRGMARFVGMTNHSLAVAKEAARSGLYDTVQFPLSALSSDEELALVPLCEEHGAGLIAMKAMCGGLLTSARAAFAALRKWKSVVPIWGVQKMEELEEFLALEADPPELDDEIRRYIEAQRKELSGDFCRGCGYCLPCPAGIPIPMAARMSLLLRRAPAAGFMTDHWRQEMAKIDDCQDCGACSSRCPYRLDTPALLRRNLGDYRRFGA